MELTAIRIAERPTDAYTALTAEQLASPLADAVRALMAGEANRFPRGELPDWCPERFGDGEFELGDGEFELGADDTVQCC